MHSENHIKNTVCAWPSRGAARGASAGSGSAASARARRLQRRRTDGHEADSSSVNSAHETPRLDARPGARGQAATLLLLNGTRRRADWLPAESAGCCAAMPGPFDYSKWDNIDTSSDEDEDEPSSADAMQSLHDYATAHGMDAELVSDTLGQCGGDPRAALEYLIDFMEMGEAPAPAPAPVPAPAPKPAAASTSRPGPAPSTAAGGGQAAGGSGSGGGGVAASSLSTWELEEEMGAGLQQIHELKQKRQGNAAALGALSSLEAGRPPHQRSDQRANRQWVNMGALPSFEFSLCVFVPSLSW
jgi:hypothetical protein